MVFGMWTSWVRKPLNLKLLTHNPNFYLLYLEKRYSGIWRCNLSGEQHSMQPDLQQCLFHGKSLWRNLLLSISQGCQRVLCWELCAQHHVQSLAGISPSHLACTNVVERWGNSNWPLWLAVPSQLVPDHWWCVTMQSEHNVCNACIELCWFGLIVTPLK